MKTTLFRTSTIAAYVLLVVSACQTETPNPESYCGPNTTFNAETQACDGQAPIVCTEGTLLVDGQCVPDGAMICPGGTTFNTSTGQCDPDITACADGTTLVNGECIPDGSVICPGGTTFNTTTGQCDPNITGCGEGTTLVNGVCVPEDSTLIDVADTVEPAEPNGLEEDAVRGSFTIPAEGSAHRLYGCIEPTVDTDENGNPDPDLDSYTFAAEGPTVLNIKVDGMGGLAAGFEVSVDEDETNPLWNAGWLRMGINLVGDTSERQVFLPRAGEYILTVGDSRSFLTEEGAGSATACYLATIEHHAIPTPAAVVDNTATGQLGLDFYSVTASVDGSIAFATVKAQSDVAGAAVVTHVGDDLTFEAASAAMGLGADAQAGAMGLQLDQTVVIVVDHVIHFGLSPVDYELTVEWPESQAAPVDGTDVTVTHEQDYYRWLYFDVETAGSVGRVQMSSPAADGLAVDIVGPGFEMIGALCINFMGCSSVDGWAWFPAAGRYYVRVYNRSATPETTEWAVTSTIDFVQPDALTIGEEITGQALGADDTHFYTVDLGDWLTYQVSGRNLGGTAQWTSYALDDAGVLDMSLVGIDSIREGGRIHISDDAKQVLVKVADTGVGIGVGEIDLVVDHRQFEDVTAELDMPQQLTALDLTPGKPSYILVRGTAGNPMTLSAKGSSGTDVSISVLDRVEASVSIINAVGADEVEVVEGYFDADGWVAVSISLVGDNAGTVDVTVTTREQVNYGVTPGMLSYVEDVCTNGAVHALASRDDGLSATPIELASYGFAFEFYGASVTSLLVSSNGWMTTQSYATSAYENPEIPSAESVNGVIAAYWDDLDTMEVCVVGDAEQLVVQWTGNLWFTTTVVQVQAVLRADHTFDIVTGPGHMADGSSATIGVEDPLGMSGTTWSYNTAVDWSITNGATFALEPVGGDTSTMPEVPQD